MLERLPEFVDLLPLADAGARWEGQLRLSGMKRLGALLRSVEGRVDVELEFGRDEQNLRYLRLRVGTQLVVICQRCLQPLPLVTNIVAALGIVRSRDEADNLPEHYEPLIVEQKTVPLAAIVEDELILALPAAPKHEDNHCIALLEASERISHPLPQNPFAVLSGLKK